MLNYFIKRIFLACFTLFIVSLVSVMLTNISKVSALDVKKNKLINAEDPIEVVFRDDDSGKTSILESYRKWIRGAVRLNFGESSIYGKEAGQVVFQRTRVSLKFYLLSFVLILVFSCWLGLFKATFFSKRTNRIIDGVIYVLNISPIYILGLFILLFFASQSYLNLFPLGGMYSDNYQELSFWGKILDKLYYGFLPFMCYFLTGVPEMTLLMQDSARATLKLDFIKTAKAKGLTKMKIIFDHVLKYSLVPVLSNMNSLIVILISASMIIENLFNINGLGRLTYKVVLERDFNVLILINLTIAMMIIATRAVSDFLIKVFDHRIEWEY